MRAQGLPMNGPRIQKRASRFLGLPGRDGSALLQANSRLLLIRNDVIPVPIISKFSTEDATIILHGDNYSISITIISR